MVIFAEKSYISHMLEAVSVSHDFPLAGVRMFGNVLALRMCSVTKRCGVSFKASAAAKQKSSRKMKFGKE